jgi:tetratricopeptide (TPR) repeat protein
MHLRYQAGDFEGAYEGAEMLLEIEIDHIPTITFQGHVRVRQGRLEEAIERYSLILDLDPGSRTILRFRAMAYRGMGNYEQALRDYDDLLAVDQSNVWDFFQRATPQWILGRPEAALADYRSARLMLGRPSFADARRYLILRHLGRDDEAQDVLDEAMRSTQEIWLRKVLRCLAGQMTIEALIADAESRGNLEQLCEAYYYAGELQLLAGEMEKARGHFRQCVQTGVELDPDTEPGTPMNEYELARWRLKALPAEPAGPERQEN